LADPQNVEDLAHQLDGLLSNPKQAESMGLAGRQRLEDYFSRRRWLKEIAAIYDDLLLTR
jgi:glycosyltransferase involved in cell wall biosynthesis